MRKINKEIIEQVIRSLEIKEKAARYFRDMSEDIGDDAYDVFEQYVNSICNDTREVLLLAYGATLMYSVLRTQKEVDELEKQWAN